MKAIVLLFFNVFLVYGQYTVPTKLLNMESADCDQIGDYTVTDQDIIKVWANPPFQNAGSGSRDKCVIRLRADQTNRRLFIFVTDVVFNDHGIQLNVYDHTSQAHPRHVLTSDSAPGLRWEMEMSVMFELIKQSTSARTYKFSIMVTTDQGPDISFEQNVNEYAGQGLTIGAIVGIAIAGGLIFLAIVGIAIYCIIKQRRKRLSKEREAGSTNAGSTVYSSSKEKYYSDSKVHLGRDFTPPTRVRSTRTYSQPSQSDHRESDIFIVKDKTGRHPATFNNDAFSRESNSTGNPIEHDDFRKKNPKRNSMEKSKQYPIYDDYEPLAIRDSKPQSVRSGESRRGDPKRQSDGKSRRYPTDDEYDERDSRTRSVKTDDFKRETSKRQPVEKSSYRHDTNAKRNPKQYDEFDYPHGSYSRAHSTKDNRQSAKYEEYDFHRGSSSRGDSTKRGNTKRPYDSRDSYRDSGGTSRRNQPPHDTHRGVDSYPKRQASPGSVKRQTPESNSFKERDSGSKKGKQPMRLGDLNINARYGNRGQLPKH